MFEAKVRRKVQTELCQLHRNFGLQTALSNALQDFEIVLHNLLSLRAILDIIAQNCEDRPDLLPTQNLCRAKRIIERFAGHEPGYSAPEKLVMCRAITQPFVLRCCSQHLKTNGCVIARHITSFSGALYPGSCPAKRSMMRLALHRFCVGRRSGRSSQFWAIISRIALRLNKLWSTISKSWSAFERAVCRPKFR